MPEVTIACRRWCRDSDLKAPLARSVTSCVRSTTFRALVAICAIGAAVAGPSFGQDLDRGATAPTASCRADLARDAAAQPEPEADVPSNAGPTVAGDSGGSLTNTISVTVPEGRLYLDDDRLTIDVPSGRKTTVAPLVADLRDARPGWQLSATLVEVRVDGHTVDEPLDIRVDRIAPIVGERRGLHVQHDGAVHAGECVSLLVADAGAGWGSYRPSITLAPIGGAHRGAGAVEAVVQLHLTPALTTP